MIYKAPRGTADLLEPNIQLVNRTIRKSREIFNLFGYKEISTPIFEDSRLFVRSLGETSDIVKKQMLNLATKDRPLTLRPEGTASVIRAYLEHSLDKDKGFIKLFYIGPMFRGERPQKGRLRQFTHIGAEAIGSGHAAVDAEIVILTQKLLDNFGLCNYEIILNSIGCAKDKERLKSILKKDLEKKKYSLCADCKKRLSSNILRILDCKRPNCRKIVQNLGTLSSFRCKACREHFEGVKTYLKAHNVKFKELSTLIRGLDYYTGTVFEITHSALGSQDAILAGGRYNNLVAQLGGSDIPAVGFALGLERVILALKSQGRATQQSPDKGLDVFLAVTKEDFFSQALVVLSKLRDAGISADIDYCQRSLKAQMRRANNLNSSFVVMLGDEEVASNKISLKDMKTGKQELYREEQVIEKIKELSNKYETNP